MQRRQRNLFTLGVISFAIGLFAILGVLQTKNYLKTTAISQEITNSQETFPSIGGEFQLMDQNGKIWKNTDFKGKPMLVYFGYSYCPDICPTALSHITEAVEELGGGKAIQPIFITLDPERDTSKNLQAYSENFHKDFLMLTGSKVQVDQAIKAYRVHAARTSENKDEEYQIDHSSIIYLVDENGNYQAHFNHETTSHEIVKKVRMHLGPKSN